jgi:hypothetical protein
MAEGKNKSKSIPAQKQAHQPGIEKQMHPRPQFKNPKHKGSGKLEGKAALITGGDSGIGRAVAIAFAREGADVAIMYLPQEQKDADETRGLVEDEGTRCLLVTGDIGYESVCRDAPQRRNGRQWIKNLK